MSLTSPPAPTGAMRLGTPLLALLAGWVSLFSWSGMVTRPRGFLLPALVIGALVVLAGHGLRRLAVPAYGVAAGQVLLTALAMHAVVVHDRAWAGVVPTWESLRRATFLVVNGGRALNAYSAPVGVNVADTRAMLLGCALLVLLSIELLVTWLRHLPLVALPLLVTLSVPVSIMSEELALPVFVATALLFLRLLGTDQVEQLRRWNRDGQANPRPLTGVLWSVSTVAVVLALLAAPLVPVTDLLNRRGAGGGSGDGRGAGDFQLTVVNPFIRLRRDLVEQTHTPMVYASTDSRETGYLRTTVLDEFADDQWRPSPRNLPSDNSADGVFPSPPGLGPGVGVFEEHWKLELAPRFTTTWLPVPYPLRKMSVKGSWRFDSRTLDIAYVGGASPQELRYSATALRPNVTAAALVSTLSAPARIRVPYTRLPDNLPEVIATRAAEVTRGADTQYAKAVALQRWFRETGGFRYSTEQRSGSGMDLLAHFVTDDRVGYCEQYAAAMAAMGRTLGIPSRVVVGFLDGTVQPDGRILYTSDDRHAWPEMYFSGIGWVRFEPTPGQRTGATPAWTRQDTDPAGPSRAPTPTASAAPTTAPDATRLDQSASDGAFASVPWRPLLAGLLLVLVLVSPSVVRRAQRRRRLAGAAMVELSEGAWSELRATALDLGLEWPEHRSPREQARRMVEQVTAGPDDVASLERLLVSVEQGRYGRADGDTLLVDREARAQTLRTVSSWRTVLGHSVDRLRGWRGRLWPVSVLRRERRGG